MKQSHKTIYTIGHSTRTTAEFVRLLDYFGIEQLVDIRTIPKSRHNPQFNGSRLKATLKRHKISYTQAGKLGGLRHAKKDSVNKGWNNLSFRGFADYMQTPDFDRGLESLIRLAGKKRTVIMCAEAVPWRCHRSLIADALKKKKWQVRHITSLHSAKPHRYTPFMKMKKGQLTYPAA